MTESGRTVGLILNGGLGRRMGGADKGLVPLGGRPMLARAIDRLKPQCAALALSANGDPARFASFHLPVLADRPPAFAGPLAGILAGLEWAGALRPPAAYVASLPADTPFVPKDFVARLHGARRALGADVALAVSDGHMHWLAALWPAALAADLRRALEVESARKVESFAARHRLALAEWPSEPYDPFFNINTRRDLDAAEAILRSASSSGD